MSLLDFLIKQFLKSQVLTPYLQSTYKYYIPMYSNWTDAASTIQFPFMFMYALQIIRVTFKFILTAIERTWHPLNSLSCLGAHYKSL